MIDLITLVNKETKRFLNVWKQTLLPPIITIVLYLMIFWKFIWDQIEFVEGVAYIEFIFPWLLMMSVIMASYANTSFSFFTSKMFHSIEEQLVSPLTSTKMVVGYCIAWILRGFIVWALVFLVGMFMIDIQIYSYFYFALFMILTALLFSLAGLLNGIYARSFDDVNIIPTFVMTPLIYLGWVFYSIEILSEFWQTVSQFNPVLYMVNGLRYAFLWISDINIYFTVGLLVICNILLAIVVMYLLKKWKWIRS